LNSARSQTIERGYKDFDRSAEKKSVLDPNGMGQKAKAPLLCEALAFTPYSLSYCRFAINVSSADFGGRVSDSGNVASGWSTTFSRSVNVGFSVLM
jgi:hypothetical protein